MANESVFSTKREQNQSANQMLENMINRKATQNANMRALTEARRLSETSSDILATMESANANIEDDVKRSSALESLAYAQGSKNIARNQLQMRNRLITEGTEYVRGRVLGDIIFESYWLDTPVKEASVEQIEESINDLFTFIEENYIGSKVPASKQTRLLENINNVIDEVVKEAVERILTEAKEKDEAFTEFSLSDKEEDDLDDKLCDLGKDEIVEIIKNKVAQVVQDEKIKGEEKSKMFDEIEASLQSSDDELTEAEEAMLIGLNTGEITLEGTTMDSIRIIWSEDMIVANKAFHKGVQYKKRKLYKKSIDSFTDAKKRYSDLLKEARTLDESAISTLFSWFLKILTYDNTFKAVRYPRMFRPLKVNNLTDIKTRSKQRWNHTVSNASVNQIKLYLIDELAENIKDCDTMIKECDSEFKKRKSVKEAVGVGSTTGYSASEKHIISLLESGVDFNLQLNTSDGDLKSFVSALCKKIHDALIVHEYECGLVLISEFEKKLSDIPETISTDVKGFILSMANMIYGAVPADEVIISRIGNPMGSPGMNSESPIINMVSMSWMDVLVNIKTNLGSIKDYCTSKIECTDAECSTPEVTQSITPTLQSMIASNQNRLLNSNFGGSIFESLMMMNISGTSRMVTESGTDISDESVEEAALIETLLQYTVLESLDTLGIYKFRLTDINSLKKTCVNAVSEGSTPVYGESDKNTVGVGSDEKTGKKKIRINTRTMRKKS